MGTSTSTDDHPAAYFYYNYICKYRIPVLIILYLVACSKPVGDGKVKSRPIEKNSNGKRD